jgi:DNA processing protein
MRDREAIWLWMAKTPGVGRKRAARLLRHFGSPERIWQAGAEELADGAGLPASVAGRLAASRNAADWTGEREALRREGICLAGWDDPAFPRRLREIPDPPVWLFVQGTLPREAPMLAVVGSRRGTSYGVAVTRMIVEPLAMSGVAIVSGLAYGIDAAAHRAALDAGGVTVAVLGGGHRRLYPPGHRELAARIAASGCLVSEFPPDTDPQPGLFPERNRLISGMSDGVLVCEAGEASGTLHTVDYALQQGREVLAVPGSILSRQSKGTNRLIAQGAGLVVSAADVIAEFPGWLVSTPAEHGHASVRPCPDSVAERAVWDALGTGAQTADMLLDATRLSAGEIYMALCRLEIGGIVRKRPGGYYILV